MQCAHVLAQQAVRVCAAPSCRRDASRLPSAGNSPRVNSEVARQARVGDASQVGVQLGEAVVRRDAELVPKLAHLPAAVRHADFGGELRISEGA